ncbi:hypothetical protein RI367_001746 [Sorochytrium milnesiophthora]
MSRSTATLLFVLLSALAALSAAQSTTSAAATAAAPTSAAGAGADAGAGAAGSDPMAAILQSLTACNSALGLDKCPLLDAFNPTTEAGLSTDQINGQFATLCSGNCKTTITAIDANAVQSKCPSLAAQVPGLDKTLQAAYSVACVQDSKQGYCIPQFVAAFKNSGKQMTSLNDLATATLPPALCQTECLTLAAGVLNTANQIKGSTAFAAISFPNGTAVLSQCPNGTAGAAGSSKPNQGTATAQLQWAVSMLAVVSAVFVALV